MTSRGHGWNGTAPSGANVELGLARWTGERFESLNILGPKLPDHGIHHASSKRKVAIAKCTNDFGGRDALTV